MRHLASPSSRGEKVLRALSPKPCLECRDPSALWRRFSPWFPGHGHVRHTHIHSEKGRYERGETGLTTSNKVRYERGETGLATRTERSDAHQTGLTRDSAGLVQPDDGEYRGQESVTRMPWLRSRWGRGKDQLIGW